MHVPTWDSAGADRLWEAASGKDRWRWTLEGVADDLRRVTDAELWQLRAAARQSLVRYVREAVARQLAARGASPAEIAGAGTLFDPQTLTIGFARRFATYKRPTLLLHDPDRLARFLSNAHRPVQLVIAGKAHPGDAAGQALVREWVMFMERPDVQHRAVFLTDYDMLMAERLVQGVDLWINTPRRPWEACGTSGMKVLVNGGLNLSELDGWWAEAYAADVGWAIGDCRDRGEDPAWEAAEAEALYALLEGDVAATFYTRDPQDIPSAWVARMRESMARLTPHFSANRTVREYTERRYLPAAAAYRTRAAEDGRAGAELVAWRRRLAQCWHGVSLYRRSTPARRRPVLVPDRGRPQRSRPGRCARGGVCRRLDGGAAVRAADDLPPRDRAARPAAISSPPTSSVRGRSATSRRGSCPRHPEASMPLEAPLIVWYARPQ